MAIPPSSKPRAYSYVRLSSDIQAKGHGRRRQTDLAKQYAEANGLELLEQFQLEDIGVSAYKGDNVAEGALGGFLDGIKKGAIPSGSYLLVESLDRLSRQQVMKSLALFLQIINDGVTIVTLSDQKVYRPEGTDFHDLLYSLVIMARAHEESLTKSSRVAAAWKNKRNQAQVKPMTKICPSWLRLSEDRARYERIDERVEVVQAIFEDAANGIGIYSIARRLNQQNTPTFNESDGWYPSYVAKILSNRAVIGEFQPHARVDGRRTPVGDAISGYYPSVVSEEIFYRAQAGRAVRLQSGRGRKGRFVSNLFSSIAKCAYCHGSIKFEDKGSGPKGGRYLVCERARRNLGCNTVRWRYNDFETSFLTFVRELDLEAALSSSDDENRRAQLEQGLRSLEGRIAEQKLKMERTFSLLETGAAVEFVSEKLAKQQAELAELVERRAGLEREQRALTQRSEAFERSKEELAKLVEQVQQKESERSFEVRSVVSAKIRDLVNVISLAPAGRIPTLDKAIAELRRQTSDDWIDVIGRFEKEKLDRHNARKYFAVGFNDGSVRIVTPAPHNPTEYQVQIASADDGLVRFTPSEATLLFPNPKLPPQSSLADEMS